MAETKNIVGIVGSLRRDSFNAALMRAAQELAGPEINLDVADLRDFPLYDGDVERSGIPAPVVDVADRIRGADGLLIATPEYNYSVSGVLKNGIDWLSRTDPKPFTGKPIALMSASPGRFGGARAQYHLRQTFVFLDGRVLNKPEVIIANAQQSIDEAGTLTDANARDLISQLLKALADAA